MTSDINTLILSSLVNKSLYGLEIIKYVKDETNGEIVLKQPSLYSALRRLEAKKLVSSYWEDSELGGKRHYYTITRIGKEILEDKLKKINKNKLDEQEKNLIQNQLIKRYSPSQKMTGSFSETVMRYSIPKQMSSNQSKDENLAKNNGELFEEVLFPDVDDDLEFNDNLNLEEEDEQLEIDKQVPKFNTQEKNEINYKDILGDLFLEEEDFSTSPSSVTEEAISPRLPLLPEIETTEKVKKEDSAITKSREYAKQISKILATKKIENPFLQDENTPKSPQSIELLEQISKRHSVSDQRKIDEEKNDFRAHQEEPQADENNIETNNMPDFIPVAREKKQYILINKLNYKSQFIIFFLMLIEIGALFAYYFIKEPVELEQYILFGISILFDVIWLLNYAIKYKKFPNKKIHKRIKWGLKFFYRFLATIILIAFVISINLIIGMENLAEPNHILRWLLPSIVFSNVLIKWFVMRILATKQRYQN